MRTISAALVVLLLSSANSYAEVMDKEPSIAENWIWSTASGLLAIAAWRWRWWSGVVVSSIALVRLAAVYVELLDPSVGPAIRAEAGERYVTQFHLAVAAAVMLHATGVYFGIRKRRVV